MVVKRKRQDEAIGLQFPAVNTIEKWNPGSDLDGPPDEVTVVKTMDDVAGISAGQIRRLRHLERRAKLLAFTVGVLIGAALAHAGGVIAYGGLAQTGANFIAAAIIDEVGLTHYTEANAHLGVGDSSTTFSTGQTDLQASSNKDRLPMDSGYPARANNVLTFKGSADASTANYQWNENAVFNASSSGTMLVRKVVNLGTKASGATWRFTKTLTITAG